MGFVLPPVTEVLNELGGVTHNSSSTVKATGGSTGGVNLNNPNIKDASSFSSALLTTIGNDMGTNVTPTAAQIGLVNAWQATEGQWSASGQFNAANMHNPLNIESTAPGSPKGTKICDSSGACTLSFPTWAEGLQATADFLKTYQPSISNALFSSSNPTSNFLQVVGNWDPGNSSYASTVSSNIGTVVAGGTGKGSSAGASTSGGWLYSYAQMLAAPGGLFGSLNVGGDIKMIVARGGTFLMGFVLFGVGLLILVGGSLLSVFRSGAGKTVEKVIP